MKYKIYKRYKRYKNFINKSKNIIKNNKIFFFNYLKNRIRNIL